MANMLIRTRQLQCKIRLAVFIRVILFFLIPSFYLIFLRDSDSNINEEFSVPNAGKVTSIYYSLLETILNETRYIFLVCV